MGVTPGAMPVRTAAQLWPAFLSLLGCLACPCCSRITGQRLRCSTHLRVRLRVQDCGTVTGLLPGLCPAVQRTVT